MSGIKATIVFEKIWNFINEVDDQGQPIPRIYKDGEWVRRYRYLILKGSSRSSKTQSLIQAAYLYSISRVNKRWSVFRNTKKSCKDTVLKDMRKIYPGMPHYSADFFNKTDSIYTFPNLSTIEITGTDEPDLVHGYNGDVLWVNEPYKISRDTFDQLDQRTADFVVADWNPKQAHWLEDIEKDDRAMLVHSTYKDNPFCPPEQKMKILSYQPVKLSAAVEEKILMEQQAREYNVAVNDVGLSKKLLRELARCQDNERKNSANPFKWQVYGLGLKGENPNRIFFWTEISDAEWAALDVPTYYGVDWGSVDPWGIVAAKYYDGGLYLKELNYKSENAIREGLTLTERQQIEGSDEGIVTWLFRKLGIPTNAYIICDTNRPLKIRALFEAGYDSAMAAPKPPGSIEDGIDLLNSLRVFYTASSKNLAYEQENYQRREDRYGNVEDEPEDRDNHCFVGDTMISTIHGEKCIDSIQVGDMVVTSKGLRPVLKVWDNGPKQVFKYSMHFDTFVLRLVCTKDHLIKTNEGWTKISKLKSGQTVSLVRTLTGIHITSMQANDILEKIDTACTGTYGNTTMGREKKGFMSIIKMATRGITELKILRRKRPVVISLSISKKGLKTILNGSLNSKEKALKRPRNGIGAMRVDSGTKSRQQIHGSVVNTPKSNASIVARLIKQDTKEIQNFAITTAKLLHLDVGEESRQPVYDLTILGEHEYFAGGVLVHNCLDPTRYVALFLFLQGIITRK